MGGFPSALCCCSIYKRDALQHLPHARIIEEVKQYNAALYEIEMKG
jgi:hypothetical protein